MKPRQEDLLKPGYVPGCQKCTRLPPSRVDN